MQGPMEVDGGTLSPNRPGEPPGSAAPPKGLHTGGAGDGPGSGPTAASRLHVADTPWSWGEGSAQHTQSGHPRGLHFTGEAVGRSGGGDEPWWAMGASGRVWVRRAAAVPRHPEVLGPHVHASCPSCGWHGAHSPLRPEPLPPLLPTVCSLPPAHPVTGPWAAP